MIAIAGPRGTVAGMALLTLTYATMAAGKSTLALQLHWQLTQSGRRVELWTFGDRSGEGRLTSRIGLAAPARAISPAHDVYVEIERLRRDGVAALVVDEVQFATAAQVDALGAAVDYYDIDVHTFGLAADFRLEPFAGTSRLLAIADKVDELALVAYCWCGAPGRCNTRVVDGRVVKDGDQVMIGDVGEGEVSYRVLCRRHYRESRLAP